MEEYKSKRAMAYEWEKTETQRAMDEFKEQEAALKRLKKKLKKQKLLSGMARWGNLKKSLMISVRTPFSMLFLKVRRMLL